MKIEEAIGKNVLGIREGRDMSQAELGEALAGYLGKPWSRQAVSAAEKGRRAFTAAELLALAHVLDTTLYRLMTPPVESLDIEMPAEGVTVSARTLTRMALPTGATESAFEQVGVSLQHVADVLDRMGSLAVDGTAALGQAHLALADAARSMVVRIEKEHGADGAH